MTLDVPQLHVAVVFLRIRAITYIWSDLTGVSPSALGWLPSVFSLTKWLLLHQGRITSNTYHDRITYYRCMYELTIKILDVLTALAQESGRLKKDLEALTLRVELHKYRNTCRMVRAKLPHLEDFDQYTDEQLLAGIIRANHCKRLGQGNLDHGLDTYNVLLQHGEMDDPLRIATELLNTHVKQ